VDFLRNYKQKTISTYILTEIEKQSGEFFD